MAYFINRMKLAGFLFLVAGGVIALVSIVMLPSSSSAQSGFMAAGLAIELAGLILVFRAHMPSKEERG